MMLMESLQAGEQPANGAWTLDWWGMLGGGDAMITAGLPCMIKAHADARADQSQICSELFAFAHLQVWVPDAWRAAFACKDMDKLITIN